MLGLALTRAKRTDTSRGSHEFDPSDIPLHRRCAAVPAAPLLFLVGSRRSAARSVPRPGSSSEPWALQSIGMPRTGANVLQQLSLRIEYRLVRVMALVAAVVFVVKAGTGRVNRTAGDHIRVHRRVDLVAL